MKSEHTHLYSISMQTDRGGAVFIENKKFILILFLDDVCTS